LKGTHPRTIPARFGLIWFRGEDFQKLANQKQELPVAAMFVNGSGQGPSQAILVSDWLISKKSSLKPLSGMN
jgi:hypothetical protein